MDKTLEIIMVAVTLLVAAVVVISMLQGQANTFSDESDSLTGNASDNLSDAVSYEICGSEDEELVEKFPTCDSIISV